MTGNLGADQSGLRRLLNRHNSSIDRCRHSQAREGSTKRERKDQRGKIRKAPLDKKQKDRQTDRQMGGGVAQYQREARKGTGGKGRKGRGPFHSRREKGRLKYLDSLSRTTKRKGKREEK